MLNAGVVMVSVRPITPMGPATRTGIVDAIGFPRSDLPGEDY